MDEKTAVVPTRTARTRRAAALAGLLLAVGAAAACGPNSTSGASASVGRTSASASPSAPAGPSASGSGPSVGASPAPSNPAPTNPGIASGEPAPVKRPATGYQLQGDRHLSVFFFAGVCDKYGLKTNESKAGQVDVQVVITQAAPKGQMCPALVKKQAVSADLQQPLAGRTVLDLASGQVLPLDSDPNGGPQ